MRLVRLVLLGLPVGLSACGHSSPSTATLSVTCDGTLTLAGAASIEVATAPGGTGTVLSFPDPVNPGHTGTLPISGGRACTIAPVLGKGDTANGHGGTG